MFSRRKAVHHRQDCPCCWCKWPHGPADIYEAWQAVGDHWLGIVIVLGLAAFAIYVGVTI